MQATPDTRQRRARRDSTSTTGKPFVADALPRRADRSSCESRRRLQGALLGRALQVPGALRQTGRARGDGVCRSESDSRWNGGSSRRLGDDQYCGAHRGNSTNTFAGTTAADAIARPSRTRLFHEQFGLPGTPRLDWVAHSRRASAGVSRGMRLPSCRSSITIHNAGRRESKPSVTVGFVPLEPQRI